MRSSSGGSIALMRARRRRIAIEDAVEHHRGGVAGKTLAAGGHLVEHHAEREQIGARIDFVAARLLRRHVGDGADRGAGHAREVFGRAASRAARRVPARAAVLRRQLREAEVEHLHRAAAGQEDVRRLDVAMQDAFGVRGVERVGDLRRDVEHLPQIERPPRQLAIERLAVEQLHREIQLALVLVEAVDRADVRMIERRRGARLAAEAFDRFFAGGVAGRQHLQRDLAAELQCPGRGTPRPSRPRPAGRGSCSARGFGRPENSSRCGRSILCPVTP